MRKISVVVLCLFAIVLLGCKKQASSEITGNNSGSAVPAKSTAPATQKEDKDFVTSESGTERAKPESGKANVQGKVLFNEKPVEGTEVKLCETFNQFGGGCAGESFTTKTDANGEYFFANVTAKIYSSLLVKVFNTRSYVFATKGYGISSAKYKIDADKTFFAPDTNLFKSDLKVQNPKSNAKIDVSSFEIKWDAYPDATYYKLTFSPKEYNYESSVTADKIEGTSYKVEKPLVNGEYNLKITAHNANDVKLSDSGDYIKFIVTGGTDAPEKGATGSGSNTNK